MVDGHEYYMYCLSNRFSGGNYNVYTWGHNRIVFNHKYSMQNDDTYNIVYGMGRPISGGVNGIWKTM